MLASLAAYFRDEVDESPLHGWLDGDSLAPFVVTPLANVLAALRLARVTEQDIVFDVGCGDARVVVAAALLCGCRASGVELDDRAARLGAAAVAEWAEQAGGRASVHVADATQPGVLTGATVVFAALLPDGLALLSDALRAARLAGARVVTLHFPLPGEKAAKHDAEHRLFLYEACG